MKRRLDFRLIDKILVVIGFIFLIYGLNVLIIIGGRRIFNYFYFVVGILVILITYINRKYNEKIKKWIKISFKILISAFLISFIFIEALIIYTGFSNPKDNADYLIILGAGVNNTGVSIDYKLRLDGGYEYLVNNPNTIAITTGAKGSNEPVSEGSAGKEYLIKKGLAQDRVLLEENSFNTNQNLENAFTIIGRDSNKRVVIVSANYHLFRARFLAKKIGYSNISLKGTRGLIILNPHYFTREYFGFIKDFLISKVE